MTLRFAITIDSFRRHRTELLTNWAAAPGRTETAADGAVANQLARRQAGGRQLSGGVHQLGNGRGILTKLFMRPGGVIPEFTYLLAYQRPPHVVNMYRAAAVQYYAAGRGGSGNPINAANQIDYFDIRTTQMPEGCLGEKALLGISNHRQSRWYEEGP